MSGSVAVLGIGGVLMGDDAVGPYVAALLSAGYQLPDDVEVLDGGAPGLDLLSFLSGRRAVIIVDSVHAAGPPGSIHILDKAALLKKPTRMRLGPHEPVLRDTLLTLDFAGEGPGQVVFVGIVPESVRTGTGLSATVQAATLDAAAEVARQLAALGVEVTPRMPPAKPDIWWEAPCA